MSNVVSLNRERTPNDLLTLKEACQKYGYKYGYLYKYSVLEKEITCYGKRGFRAVSESELLKFIQIRKKIRKKFACSESWLQKSNINFCKSFV